MAVLVTGRQIAASDQAAVREKRQESYAELLVSADEYLSALGVYVNVALQPLPEDVAQLEAAEEAFRQDLTVVVLLGSDEVRAEAFALQHEFSDLHTDVVRVTAEERNSRGARRLPPTDSYGRQLTRFVDAARDELT